MDISGIDCLGLDRVLKRGSGEIIAEQEDALFIRDRISQACFLACENAETGIGLLDIYLSEDCNLLMVSDYTAGKTAFERFGFSGKLECYQAAYFGDKPSLSGRLSVRPADERDLAVLMANYHLVSREELENIVRRKGILLGYYQNRLIGFIGEHLEGSMGILYVFPEFRRRGFGAELQRHLMLKTMAEGYIPFGQVEKDNYASLSLQKKAGMTISDHLSVWMWR